MFRLIFCICFLLFYCEIHCAEIENNLNEILLTNENEGKFKNPTPVSSYDEHLLEDIERHLKVINLGQENQRLGYELLTKKVDDINNQLNDLIAATKIVPDNEKSKIPKSCDAALQNTTAKNGVYRIQIQDQYIKIEPFYVYCMRNPKTNEVWTIIHRRMNGNIDFYRNWYEYKVGFGHLLGDYWLGLDKIHALTNSKPHKLWIELKDFDNATHTAEYDRFAIGNEDTKYALNILGEYTGNAGDSLSYHAGMKFSTKDNDNDKADDFECAVDRKGAWWFHNCAKSHLNGEYLKGPLKSEKFGMGVTWYSLQNRHYPLKYAHMAIRAID